MLHQNSSSRPTDTSAQPADPGLPQPSQGTALAGHGLDGAAPLSEQPDPRQIINADDFWGRLGI